MNNTEEIFIFKIAELEPKIKILFYRINLRNEENEIGTILDELITYKNSISIDSSFSIFVIYKI